MLTKIQAHRGASAYRPENTLESFALAIEQNADGVELDVHLSKDGHVMVAHDSRLERVSNGSGHIKDHTLVELKSLNFNKLFPDQPVSRIPTLGEVYELVKSTGLTVNVELKTTEHLYPELPEKLMQLEREYAMDGRILYSSFNHYSLLDMRKLNPSAKIGLLYELGMVHPWVYAKYISADAIHPHYLVITAFPDTVVKCHEAGVLVNVWTVDEQKALETMYKYGVDAVITDKPDVAAACRDGISQRGK